jgi:hypothetical protein
MFKQRSGVLQNTNTTLERAKVPSLNDFSDDDDDDGLQAFSSFNNSNKSSQPRFNSTTHHRAHNAHHNHHDDSVMSENLSVGDDNSGDESFSMND